MADLNPPTRPAFPAGPSGPARPGLFWPVVLVGAGIVALLFNLGWLNWTLASRIGAFWPLLLILLGVQVLLGGRVSRRIVTVTGAVLIVLVLLAIMAGIASLPRAYDAAWSSRTTSFSGPRGSLSSARLDLSTGGSRLTVSSADLGSDLYRASITGPASEAPTAKIGEDGTLRISTPSRSAFGWPWTDAERRLQLTLSNHLPWRLDVNAGAANGTLDLSGLRLSSVSIDSGASDLRLLLPAPTGTVPVTVSGGALHLVINRPAGTETRVAMDGGASNLSVDGNHLTGFAQKGQAFVSPGYGAAADRIDIRISSGASDITVGS